MSPSDIEIGYRKKSFSMMGRFRGWVV